MAGVAGMAFAGILYLHILAYPAGTEKMRAIAEKIRSGALSFMCKEYRIIAYLIVAGSILLSVFFGIYTGIAFILGALSSMAAGWIGVKAATSANVRTCQGAKDGGLWRAFSIAFQGGAVMGITVAALGVISISLISFFINTNLLRISQISIGFALGASCVALFARVGGGIFTKSADIGADLAGKLETGIPEDDYRNPGVIADNVGDCVGDTAGMGADLFESYVGSVIAALAIGATTTNCVACMSLPLLVISIGLISSMISVIVMRFLKGVSPQTVLRYSVILGSKLLLIGSFFAVIALFGNLIYFWVILTGILCGIITGIQSDYFTSGIPVKAIARASESGSANTIITGFAVGFKSAVLPILTNCLAIFIAYRLAGLYGIALSAVGMLSTVGVIMTADSFGPIVDTAGGIATMSGAGSGVRNITDELDSLGNTTAAAGKGFAISSAAMTATAFFSAYLTVAGLDRLSITSLNIGIGLLIGAVVPFAIAAMTMDSVSRTAAKMVEEIRRQFAKVKGLLEGKAEPDVDRCIDIVTKGSLEELIFPGIIAVGLPLLIGFTMGRAALGGFLAGAIVTGVILGLVMTHSGAAWDNAKKWIEKGNLGGRGSEAHKASVIGDTVGDPMKDTAGPAMNIIIKLMAVVSLIFAPFFH